MPKISYRVRPETAVLTRGFDPGVVGRLGAAAGLSQFDLRLSESGGG